jgi:hypothetical protein
MPKLSAIVYAHDAERDHLDKTLESLRVCDDILLINADGSDAVNKLSRRFKARVKNGIPGVTPGAYLMDTYRDWILVLRPGEAIDEELGASLTTWRRQKRDDNAGYRFAVREERDGVFRQRGPELRLVNRKKINWTGELPPNAEAPTLRGTILRYTEESTPQRMAS